MTDALEIDGTGKRYAAFALQDVSLTLPRGAIMGLIGPNGAGKTTLLKLVLNLVHPDSGAIRAFGLDVVRDESAVRARAGFVHQPPAYYPHLTVSGLGRLMAPFYPGWDQPQFDRLTREFGLPPRQKFGTLSRGMQTKAALALALSHRAELLVFDEPTSGLDPVFRRELLDRLASYVAEHDASVVLSTHITSDLERGVDYIAYLSEGRLVFSSTRDEVMDGWALVKGPADALDEGTRAWLQGVEVGPHGFTGVSRDLAAARRRFAGTGVIVERPSLEDIMFYTRRPC